LAATIAMKLSVISNFINGQSLSRLVLSVNDAGRKWRCSSSATRFEPASRNFERSQKRDQPV